MVDWPYYAKSRENLLYYQAIGKLIDPHRGERLIDVGNGFTDLIYRGDFARRTAVNLQPMPEREGVETVIGDWLDVRDDSADVVVCSQVLEHLDDDVLPKFVAKLLAAATRELIVSVPFCWPANAEPSHKQDPINLGKFQAMIGVGMHTLVIVTESTGTRRIIGTVPF